MAAMLMEMAMAANYTVGAPNGGWDQSTNLQAWANSISFFEGDFLSESSFYIIFNFLIHPFDFLFYFIFF